MALTLKRQVFVEEYLTCWNASEAARRAGYKAPGQEGHRLLKNAEIQEEISRRVADKAMTANEVLVRLAEQARGEGPQHFLAINDRWAVIDMGKAEDAGKLHLLKKYKTGKAGTEVEWYDAQSALVHLGRHLKLFTDKSEVSGPDGEPIPIAIVKMPVDEL